MADTHLNPVFDLLVAHLVEQEEVQLLLELFLSEDPPLIKVTRVRPISQCEFHFLCGKEEASKIPFLSPQPFVKIIFDRLERLDFLCFTFFIAVFAKIVCFMLFRLTFSHEVIFIQGLTVKNKLLKISFTDYKKCDQKATERHNCTSPECDFSSVVYIYRVAVTTKNSTDLLGDKFVDVHIVG